MLLTKTNVCFWHWLIWFVMDKVPLNGFCVIVSEQLLVIHNECDCMWICAIQQFFAYVRQQLMWCVDGRLLNDLVLWEPVAPKPIDTQETNNFMPGSAWSPHLVAQLMHQGPVSESFSACKSGIQYGVYVCPSNNNVNNKQICIAL